MKSIEIDWTKSELGACLITVRGTDSDTRIKYNLDRRIDYINKEILKAELTHAFKEILDAMQ